MIHLSFTWNQHPLSTDQNFDDAHWRICLYTNKMLNMPTGEFVDDEKNQLTIDFVDAVENCSLQLFLLAAH